jgi:5-methylcytosine-specific restriction endonuclease McrA
MSDTPISDLPWPKIRKLILERDQYICGYCLDDADHVDHILPRYQGGSNDPSNLIASCGFCNRSKGYLTPEQWSWRDQCPLPPWYYERRAAYG